MLILIPACIAMVCLIIVSVIRHSLIRKSSQLSEEISHIQPFSKNESISDIQADFNTGFHGVIVSARQKQEFAAHYDSYYQEAVLLVKRLEKFKVKPSDTVLKFIRDFKSIDVFVRQHNDKIINDLLATHKVFFDTCLKYPLDGQQRRSIVSEEDNCLVVSSAGSGKTSSIVGKVKYLTEVKGIDPKRILLISYTNKAAAELTERIDTEGLRGYTFHKLAIDMIGKATGVKPSICDNTDSLFLEIYRKLLTNSKLQKSIVDYFIDYPAEEDESERLRQERLEELSEQKKPKLKALFPDMDGRAVYVRSEQERKICFALSSLGVKFRYEERYEHLLADENHSQYTPDFSIYFDRDGKLERIYLEHFGVDCQGRVPQWFAKDNNMTYEEANQKYNDGITWKRAAHKKFGTRLLETSSADFDNDIKKKLKELLENAGVPVEEKSYEELYDLVLPKGSKQEKAFIRLIVTFVTLFKSCGRNIDDIMKQAKDSHDDRSRFLINNIFKPVFMAYQHELNERQQVDFTDVILKATELCKVAKPITYDYIIVDEFQDISVDRYNFLKVLRDGNPPAKLYCVGDDWQSIYRFSGSDMALFSRFSSFFGETEINKIETTYRFGEPMVSLSSRFIQRNNSQIQKNVRSFNPEMRTDLEFCAYNRRSFCDSLERLVSQVPRDKSLFLLGRYSFDDYYLSYRYQSVKEGSKFFYIIDGRKIEFLTVHKSKGLEADYVILLQCNKDIYGFPSLVSDDPVLSYVLTDNDSFPFGEERRLFYVAVTRAKVKTFVMYDMYLPSVFVDEFLHPEKLNGSVGMKYPNANKRWTRAEDRFLLTLQSEGKSIKDIALKMGRSQTAILMRLEKLS